jgi:hypothetical protein
LEAHIGLAAIHGCEGGRLLPGKDRDYWESSMAEISDQSSSRTDLKASIEQQQARQLLAPSRSENVLEGDVIAPNRAALSTDWQYERLLTLPRPEETGEVRVMRSEDGHNTVWVRTTVETLSRKGIVRREEVKISSWCKALVVVGVVSLIVLASQATFGWAGKIVISIMKLAKTLMPYLGA